MGIAIVGGLLLSQFLTLFTTPIIYLALDRLQRICHGSRSGPADARAVVPTFEKEAL
jgi:hypothetical protein